MSTDTWRSAWDTARAFINGFWGMVEKVPGGRGDRLMLALTTLIEADRAEQRQRLAFLQQALMGIRDRYIKKLPGIAKKRCTLCGVDDGELHGIEFNCGQADAALQTALGKFSPGQRVACAFGVVCERHGFEHGAEAEELRQVLEEHASDDDAPAWIRRALDRVDARDSAAWLEHQKGDVV